MFMRGNVLNATANTLGREHFRLGTEDVEPLLRLVDFSLYHFQEITIGYE